ncbi:MAG: thioredoxin [Kiritimatiellae bacterium]|jgi:thioredoxin 1|nr:thioredoxin [Kiritimatiellia bacterium]
MEAQIIELTNANFDSTISQGLTLVDFWAPWCMPCKLMGPIFDMVAEQLGDKVRFAKVNIDKELELANRLGIQSIPTLMLFKDGVDVDVRIGLTKAPELIAMIKEAM